MRVAPRGRREPGNGVRLRILHVIPAYAPAWGFGGPLHSLFDLSREQVRQGHRVTVMTTNIDVAGVTDVPLGRPVTIEGAEIWYWPIRKPGRFAFSPTLSGALCEQVARFEVVNIHSLFNWPASFGAYWARRRRVPYIVRPAGSLDPISLAKSYDAPLNSLKSRAKKWLYFKTLAQLELNRAAAIHFTTEAEREAARPLGLRSPAVVIPLGVSPAPEQRPIRDGLRERYSQLRDKKLILFLSRIDRVKGLELLIAAAAELSRTRDDFALIVAGGGNSSYRREIADLVASRGLAGRTAFLGPVFGEAKWDVLRQADIFALTSHHENFGIAVAEALAAGLPVLISDRINISAQVRDRGAGLVVSLQPSDIARGLERLLDNESLRGEMGRKGRLLAVESFAWPQVVKDLTSAYDRAVAF